MALHELAGKPVPEELLIDLDQLERAYYEGDPDPSNPLQRVSFGTSGHRGSSLDTAFCEGHILAITQAICEYRRDQGIKGPVMMGMDTHALSGPAQRTALEVLAGNGVTTWIQAEGGFTPTPVISHAILNFNRKGAEHQADGIVITPSHNPPRDGGFKYNPPHGGPAGTEATDWIEKRANELLAGGNADIERMSYGSAMTADTTRHHDYVTPYVDDLGAVIDMDCIRSAGLKLGVDPLGGAGAAYWDPIAEKYGLDITIVNPTVDPQFGFMSVDKDGKIRMDCSSPYAMAQLVKLKDKYDVAFGNDPDADRHGIVARSCGLLNPNHYLAVAINYLFAHRPDWPAAAAVGKTLVSSGIIDRVAADLGRTLAEVPVGFKWFVEGLLDGNYGFGGEESAGASFLRRDGTVWTTDKDGPIMCLLAAEMTARTGKDPGEQFAAIAAKFGTPYYSRVDGPCTLEQKAALKQLSPEAVQASTLAGEPITAKLTKAPGNNAAIGGLKVTTDNGWFCARPSGTEPIYKIYAESFLSEQHLEELLADARRIVDETLA